MIEYRKTKDLELFLKRISKLEDAEFIGLAKLLKVKIVEFDIGEKKDNGATQVTPKITPTETIISEMIDNFLKMRKANRTKILKMIKRD